MVKVIVLRATSVAANSQSEEEQKQAEAAEDGEGEVEAGKREAFYGEVTGRRRGRGSRRPPSPERGKRWAISIGPIVHLLLQNSPSDTQRHPAPRKMGLEDVKVGRDLIAEPMARLTLARSPALARHPQINHICQCQQANQHNSLGNAGARLSTLIRGEPLSSTSTNITVVWQSHAVIVLAQGCSSKSGLCDGRLSLIQPISCALLLTRDYTTPLETRVNFLCTIEPLKRWNADAPSPGMAIDFRKLGREDLRIDTPKSA
ncbi:hypothetical protein HYALB_00001148 [Hymenoscyphus albidus]|uniref:Uncharacterized protein n=1 Tax=Hymenoscyphus albidus TaxID=595503 RepID=A0A9N9LHJ2_9HELO|nr:hypothetical protein HYALB_00001148 [Hymenoscyphus albidus]